VLCFLCFIFRYYLKQKQLEERFRERACMAPSDNHCKVIGLAAPCWWWLSESPDLSVFWGKTRDFELQADQGVAEKLGSAKKAVRKPQSRDG
jgi:hypothetical protein